MSCAGLLVALFAGGPIAFAADPPPEGQCPENVTCAQMRKKIATYRKELKALEAQLGEKDSDDIRPDEDAIERDITDLRNLSRCMKCTKKLRSDAHMAEAWIVGLLAKYYDSWGIKKGKDGRRSFRATREATRVDPENLAAWTSYGKALVAIAGKTLKSRIAKYLGIDLEVETRNTASQLTRLLAKGPSDPKEAREVLAALKPLIE